MKLAVAGCAAQVILPVDERCKDASTHLKQLKGHKLGDIAVSLLNRFTGPENVCINAEWLKLQPWRSDAEGAVFRMAADMSSCYPSPRCAIQGDYVKSKSHIFPALTKQTR